MRLKHARQCARVQARRRGCHWDLKPWWETLRLEARSPRRRFTMVRQSRGQSRLRERRGQSRMRCSYQLGMTGGTGHAIHRGHPSAARPGESGPGSRAGRVSTGSAAGRQCAPSQKTLVRWRVAGVCVRRRWAREEIVRWSAHLIVANAGQSGRWAGAARSPRCHKLNTVSARSTAEALGWCSTACALSSCGR